MSEPLKPEEVVKFGDQVRKLFGWVKKLFTGSKKTAAIIAIGILSLTVTACETFRAVVRVINSIPIPEPNPTAKPTDLPTPFPTISPSATPARTPNIVHTPTPIIVPAVTPTPVCLEKPSSEPVSLTECRAGDVEIFGPDDNPSGKRLCGLNIGTGDSNTAWRLWYGIAKQGMKVENVNGKWLQFNPDRGFTDKLGRYFPDGVNLYVHPDGFIAPWTWGGYVVPEFCADPLPEAKNYPIIGFQKIQGYNPKPGVQWNCHNPQDGPKAKNCICLKDTTRFLCDPNNSGNCGPCDTDHMVNWNSFCLEQDYDPKKIRFTVKHGTAEETDNPSQYEVHFSSGVPFTACAAALPYGIDETTTGLKLQQKSNTETCVTETYTCGH